MFHYKILNNGLYFDKQLFHLGLVTSKLCWFCNQVHEILIHLVAECSATKMVWKKLNHCFTNALDLSEILP